MSQVRWAQSAGPPDMNPLRRFDVEGAMVLALGLETLVKFGNDFKIAPALADDFSHSKDLKEWSYRLRRGEITFWDGSRLTIDDVVYSYQQHLTNPQSAFGFFYGIVADVRRRGKDALLVRLKQPDILFQYTPAHTAGLVYQKSGAEKVGKRLGTPGNLPVGTGPFQFTKYVQNDRVELKRFDGYWEKKPTVEELTVRAIPDDSSRLIAMRTGEIGGTFDVPPEQFKQWTNAQGVSLQKASGLGVVYLSFNVKKAPFDDIAVRRAFAYALDRKGLVSSATQGSGEVATAFVPPRFWSALNVSEDEVRNRYADMPQYDFDLDRARAELKKSKYAGGTTIRVVYPGTYQRLGKALLSVKENLAPMGVRLDVGEITEDQWFANLYEHKNDIGLQVVLYRPDYPDPANYASFFSTDQIEGGNNFGNYSNPQVDELLLRQRTVEEASQRTEPLMRVIEIVARDVAVAPIWWESSLLATQDDFTAYPSPVWYLVPWATSIKAA
ncbi:MAG: ABC transporter substrate-binding protein [Actinomycetota bacterium]|nr:ABC transporter substrate-binding protein [Actinomycetota bacterium]